MLLPLCNQYVDCTIVPRVINHMTCIAQWLKSVSRNEQRLQQVAYHSPTCVNVTIWTKGIVHHLLTLMPLQTWMTYFGGIQNIFSRMLVSLSHLCSSSSSIHDFHALLMQSLCAPPPPSPLSEWFPSADAEWYIPIYYSLLLCLSVHQTAERLLHSARLNSITDVHVCVCVCL